jgi:Domain of Unknown Function (DUF1259)
MTNLHLRAMLRVAAIAILATVLAAPARAAALSGKELGRILEQTPVALSGGVLKFSWPRTDLRVRVGKIEIAPALAMKSWAAFEPAGQGNSVLLTGELVVTEREAQAAIDALQSANLNVTGIGDHLAGETPRLVFMDFTGGGLPSDLAAGLMKALRKTATPLGKPEGSHLLRAAEAEPTWTAAVRSGLGRAGTWRHRVLTVNVPRNEEIRLGVTLLDPPMGTSVSLHFQSAGSEVASAGQLVLQSDEVNPVIAELRRHGIEITALNDHLLTETPRLFFVHYWAVGKPGQIAAALAAALDRMGVRAAK